MERHISSFFQRFGSKPLHEKSLENASQTIIGRLSSDQLQEEFVKTVARWCKVPHSEALTRVCLELGVDVASLNWDEGQSSGLFESDVVIVHTFRFDRFFAAPQAFLDTLVGKSIALVDDNRSNGKWYAGVYSDFKKQLLVPAEIVNEIYESRRDPIDLFYSEGFDAVVNRAMVRYASGSE